MIFPYVKQANTKMQVHKYTNTEHTTKWQKKTCGIFLKQLYNSSNMINAESAQFTRSSYLSDNCNLMRIKNYFPHQPESHIYIKSLNHAYIKRGLEIGPQVYLRTKNIVVGHRVGSVLTNATFMTMHPFRMYIWRHIWKTQRGKVK